MPRLLLPLLNNITILELATYNTIIRISLQRELHTSLYFYIVVFEMTRDRLVMLIID